MNPAIMRNNRQRIKSNKIINVLAGLSLVVATAGFSPLIHASEQTAGGDAAISQDTANEILKELKNIRQVLEKIEKQGGVKARPSRPTTAKVSAKGKQTMGDENAPVTVVEFTDYQCPFCLRFTTTTFPLLKSRTQKWACSNDSDTVSNSSSGKPISMSYSGNQVSCSNATEPSFAQK